MVTLMVKNYKHHITVYSELIPILKICVHKLIEYFKMYSNQETEKTRHR
jgi:hypothetical protein